MTAPITATEEAPRTRRWLPWLLLAFVVALIAIRIALSYVIASQIEAIASESLGVPVSVGDVELSLFNGEFALDTLRIGGVEIDGTPAPDDLLQLERVFVRVGILASLTDAPLIEQIRLSAPRVRLRQLDDGSLDAERLAESSADATEAPAPSEPSEPLRLKLNALEITGLDFELTDLARPDAAPVQLSIGDLRISNLSVDGERIEVERLSIQQSGFDLGGLAALGFAFSIEAEDISNAPGQPFAVSLKTAMKRPASDGIDPLLELEGEAVIAPAAFDGRFETRELPLAPLLAAANTGSAADWLRAGTTSGALSIQLSTDADGARDLRVAGKLSVDALSIRSDIEVEAPEIALAWKSLEIDLREARVRVAADGSLPTPPEVHFSSITLLQPDGRFTQGGKALKALAASEDTEGSEAAVPAESSAPPAAPKLSFDALKITGGRFEFVDLSTKPSFRDRVEELELEAEGIDPAARTVEKLDLGFKFGKGVVGVRGRIGNKSKLAIDVETLPLAPFNAYAMTQAGYVIEKGTLSLESRISHESDTLDAKNAITLRNFDMRETTAGGFEEQFGMSLPVALALLRDYESKIALDVPFKRTGDQTDLELGKLVFDALRKALVGAITSPLKLVFGGVPGADEDAGEPLIPAAPGTSDFAEVTRAQIEQLAELLRTHPSLAVSLRGQVGREDGLEEGSTEPEGRLDALGQSRSQRVAVLLTEDHGVPADQVRFDSQVPIGPPGVLVRLVAR